jgi:hypothetical protein
MTRAFVKLWPSRTIRSIEATGTFPNAEPKIQVREKRHTQQENNDGFGVFGEEDRARTRIRTVLISDLAQASLEEGASI